MSLSELSSRVGAPIVRAPSRQLILVTFLLGLAVNLAPWPVGLPVPDGLAVAIVFWSLLLPTSLSLLLVWVLGLLMDVHQGLLLGQTAMAYSLLCLGASAMHRRLSGFTVASQALHLFALFALVGLVVGMVRWLTEARSPGLSVLLMAGVNTLSWIFLRPIIMRLLSRRTPQRKPRSDGRPIL